MTMQVTPSIPKNILVPFQRFVHTQASGGILLLICTAIAMIWANSALGESYQKIINWELTIQVGSVFKLAKPLILWVNDGLMAIFFFVVGLEIKREIMIGELSSLRSATLPIFAALGGMLVPALTFILLHGEDPGSEGWGIPMATDIAFSLGVLSLLGKRVPLALKVFLAAFAIVDDLGAVVVIAAFYSETIGWDMLGIAMAVYVMFAVAIRLGLRNTTIFMIIGGVVWYYFLKSGLHPTVAGVMLAFIIPLKRQMSPSDFYRISQQNLKPFSHAENDDKPLLTKSQLEALDNLEDYYNRIQSPLQWLEHQLHNYSSYLIMPVFALANAGVLLSAPPGEAVVGPLTGNIALALVLGKVFGILFFVWIGVKLGFTELPAGSRWIHFVGLGLLGGIGFTMSMFISSLAFTDPTLMNHAKIGILIGSMVAGLSGYFLLRFTLKPEAEKE